MSEHCPTCGRPARIAVDDAEGAHHYEPVEPAALAEREALRERLRTALETIPFREFGEAQANGLDAWGAWKCFREAATEHIRAALAETPEETR